MAAGTELLLRGFVGKQEQLQASKKGRPSCSCLLVWAPHPLLLQKRAGKPSHQVAEKTRSQSASQKQGYLLPK